MTRKRYRQLLTAWAHAFCKQYNMPKGSAGRLIRFCNRNAAIAGTEYSSYEEIWKAWTDSKVFKEMGYKAE